VSVESLDDARRRKRRRASKRPRPETPETLADGEETLEDGRARKKKELSRLIVDSMAEVSRRLDERDAANGKFEPKAFAAECLMRALRRYDLAHNGRGPLRAMRLIAVHAVMFLTELSVEQDDPKTIEQRLAALEKAE